MRASPWRAASLVRGSRRPQRACRRAGSSRRHEAVVLMDHAAAKQGTDLQDIARLILDQPARVDALAELGSCDAPTAADIALHVDLWLLDRRHKGTAVGRCTTRAGGIDLTRDGLNLAAQFLLGARGRLARPAMPTIAADSCYVPGSFPRDSKPWPSACNGGMASGRLCRSGDGQIANRFYGRWRGRSRGMRMAVRSCPLTSVRLGSARPSKRLTLESLPAGVPRLRCEREYQSPCSSRGSAGSLRAGSPRFPEGASCRSFTSGARRWTWART